MTQRAIPLPPWAVFVQLMLIAGHPKIPLLGIPLSLLVLLVYHGRVLSAFTSHAGRVQLAWNVVFLVYCVVRITLSDSPQMGEYVFSATLFYKFTIGIYLAFLIADSIALYSKVIWYYLLLQLAFISFSAYEPQLFEFLLAFQTSEARAVFGEIFGLRSLGFGVFHNEGATFLVLLYTWYIFAGASGWRALLLAPLLYSVALTSRMALLMLPVLQAVLAPRHLIAAVMGVAVLVLLAVDLEAGPLAEAFEIYNNFVAYGEFYVRNVEHISEMPVAPAAEQLSTWVAGDGRFFDGPAFYMETDIGFSRILFFGGLAGTFLYVMASLWPLACYKSLMPGEQPGRRLMMVSLVLFCFVLSNVKGINIQNWTPLLLLLLPGSKSGRQRAKAPVPGNRGPLK